MGKMLYSVYNLGNVGLVGTLILSMVIAYILLED